METEKLPSRAPLMTECFIIGMILVVLNSTEAISIPWWLAFLPWYGWIGAAALAFLLALVGLNLFFWWAKKQEIGDGD